MTRHGDDRLRRRPYLQRTGETATAVTWTALRSASGHVVVTTPDNERIGAFPAVPEPTGSLNVTQFTARMTGLEPDTVYCYTVGDEGGEIMGRIGFRTAKRSGPRLKACRTVSTQEATVWCGRP